VPEQRDPGQEADEHVEQDQREQSAEVLAVDEHEDAERAEQAVDRGGRTRDRHPRVTEQLDGHRAAQGGQQVQAQEPAAAQLALELGSEDQARCAGRRR
jgi:hypothetical protein